MLPANGNSGLNQRGFTLIEMLVAMVIASIILGGFINLFIHASRTNDKNVKLEQNLYTSRVATRIINKEIRNARMACLLSSGGKTTLVYYPILDTSVVAACQILPQYGYFQYDPATSTLCWRRPNGASCDPIVRNAVRFSVNRVGAKVWRIRVYGQGNMVKVYTTVSTRN